jgi:hypothetical protein
VLREELATDTERLRRFQQEARSASALNHPNIITIHDFGDHGSTPFIAMEYVDGMTSREVISGGPLPTDRLLRLATYAYAIAGKIPPARRLVKRLIEVDPLSPLNQGMPGFVEIMDRRFEAAVPRYRRVTRMDPDNQRSSGLAPPAAAVETEARSFAPHGATSAAQPRPSPTWATSDGTVQHSAEIARASKGDCLRPAG